MQNQNYKEAIKSDIFSIITRASEILEVKDLCDWRVCA